MIKWGPGKPGSHFLMKETRPIEEKSLCTLVPDTSIQSLLGNRDEKCTIRTRQAGLFFRPITDREGRALKVFQPYKGRDVCPGQRVQVYRNVKKPGVAYSIRDVASGLVLGHTSELLLNSCTFTVKQGGRKRVLREREKNVHAWIEGHFGVIHAGDKNQFEQGNPVKYDPYKYEYFVTPIDGKEVAVDSAGLVFISENGVFMM